MTVGVEYVREICKKNKIAISVLEKECEFSNGYLNPKKASKIPYERALKILEYFRKCRIGADLNRILGVVTMDYIISEEDKTVENKHLTTRDKRDIAEDLDRIMEEIANDTDGPLFYHDQPIPKNKIDLLRNAIEVALEDARLKIKDTYQP